MSNFGHVIYHMTPTNGKIVGALSPEGWITIDYNKRKHKKIGDRCNAWQTTKKIECYSVY